MRISDWSSDVCSSDLAHLGMGFRAFGVVVDPGLMRGVREHEPQPPLELAAQHRLYMTCIPQHTAARDSFTNANNISCHGRSFDGRRTQPQGESRGGALRSEEHTSELQSLRRI